MKLEELKKDKYCTKFTSKQISLIKKYFKIKPNKRVFAFYSWCKREYFLCDNKVFICRFNYNKKEELIFESLYVVTLKNKDVIEFKTIIPDDTTPKFKEFRGVKIDRTNKIYTKEEFLAWLDSPCTTTDSVNITFYRAIKFLNSYKKDTFKSENYLFYVKRDNDTTSADYFYAYDIKNKTEMKLYINPYFGEIAPWLSAHIMIQDLSGKISEYQKLKCRKKFIEFIKKPCKELGANNYFALEFVKQCIQPIEKDRGWFSMKVFAGDFEFSNIWVDDFNIYDGKPYFIITEDKDEWLSKKVAVVDMLKPDYKSKEAYISDHYKRNHWEMDDKTIKKLTDFLKAPFDYKKTYWYKKSKHPFEDETIKTNWQWLISQYNDNMFGTGKNELPLDLPMPDYLLLKNSKVKI